MGLSKKDIFAAFIFSFCLGRTALLAMNGQTDETSNPPARSLKQDAPNQTNPLTRDELTKVTPKTPLLCFDGMSFVGINPASTPIIESNK